MNKDDIRSRVKARKSLLSQEEKTIAARNVFDRLERSAAFLLADKVLMYHRFPTNCQPANSSTNGGRGNTFSSHG